MLRVFEFLVVLLLAGTPRHAEGYLEYIAARLPLEGTPSAPGSPWPLPQLRTSFPELVTIPTKDNYAYSVNVPDCAPLESAFQNRFQYDLLFRDTTQPEDSYPELTRVEVVLPTGPENECDKHPRLMEEAALQYESYNLTVSIEENVGIVRITANTVWGALHGLETYSHLLWEGAGSHFFLNVTEISDWPRYPHRGLMIDTARHYLYPSTILRILDGMAYNKLNVLHWHIVDDQSFPFVSTTFPDLSAKGAYRPDFIYDPTTVQSIIEEARLRGIRVILEFDTPGHTQGFGKAYPELLTPCYGEGPNSPGTPHYPDHAPFEILDPTKEFTFDFMRDFFTEIVVAVSKDEFVHSGMDEVYYKCWESSPVIAEFMAALGYVNISQVQQYYTERHLEMVKGLGARSIVWNDPLGYGVKMDEDVIVQVWKGGETGWVHYFEEALKGGYKVLLSSCWYLNYIEYGQTWRNYYACDPVMNLTGTLTPEEEKQILGGEAAIWGEYVDDTNILPRFFPFVSAVAEKLWSQMNVSSADDAMWRLDEHRCRMLWRGLPAQPILNGYCDPR